MATSTAQSNSPDFASTLQFYSSSAAPPVLSNQDKMVNLGKRAGQSIQTNAPVVLGAISSAIAGAMNTVKDAASGATGASTSTKTDGLDTFDLELGKVKSSGQPSSQSSTAPNASAEENVGLFSQWTNSAMQSGSQAFQGMKQQATGIASTRDMIGKFIMLFAAGCICMMLALTFLPMVVIAPQKFALMFTVGSCLILASFSVLKGHAAFIAHIMSPEKRVFTAGYVASLVATLYGALVSKSYILTVVFSLVQVVALAYFLVSYIPGGTRALTMIGGAAMSTVKNLFSTGGGSASSSSQSSGLPL
ncbi:integral membrane protein, putative [Perkinsus marinus ATCC 50983]|uniref:Vesicle transport protein n=1 Tax=Perkinsus marinus (strain ATCC 50983 / TXsc) TaxID=423536 RepID=C5LIM1_PERM5|nr:integral membrane protein, putative [Perkinsus marinus ATCC 50983]EER03424.1 integral membrane protein, putative [Perkinsus marinus ATCC 50983]|eukprot:XP_002771608.1 integral membrane protein, putative [Perkinsus marinus ATCC 50983]